MSKKKTRKNPPHRGALHDRLRTRVHHDKQKAVQDRVHREEVEDAPSKAPRRRDT